MFAFQHPGRLKLMTSSVIFKNIKTGRVDTFLSTDLEKATWLMRARGYCLKLTLNNGTIHRFDGIKENVSHGVPVQHQAFSWITYLTAWACLECFTKDAFVYYTPRNEVRGGILDSPCLSVCPSVCLSVCSLTFRVRPVASTVQDGFSPYLVQMINSKRGCVACDDLWPWPISSRSFGLDLENRVRSVASTVLDGFFFYIAQIITIIRGCVACYDFFRIWKFEFLANFWNFSTFTLKKKIYNSRWILSIFSTNDH